jgi:hypothetical protein
MQQLSENTECRAAFENRFFTGMSDPSYWSEDTTKHMELIYQIFQEGWDAARATIA